jgi:hypothetical protein
MTLLFLDLRRELGARGVRFWAALVWDVVRTAPALHIAALRSRWDAEFHIEEGTMRPMAILGIVVGAFEALNAVAELWAGGVRNGDGYSLAWGTLVALVGALLLWSGIALLRRTATAAAWARGAAVACLAVFACMALVQPRMSMVATVLGIVFPVALLIVLRGGRGRSGPIVA